jgi:hypothetical protein
VGVDGGKRLGQTRQGLHGGAHAQRPAGGHAALQAARATGAAGVAVLGQLDLVVGGRAGGGRAGEPLADLDALERLDAHQRARQARVELAVPVHVAAQPGRQAGGHDLDDAAERVAVGFGALDRGDHRLTGGRVGAAHRVGVDLGLALGAGRRRVRADLADAHRVADHRDAGGGQQLAGDGGQRHAGGGLAGAGALQGVAHVVVAVLLRAHQVGVAGPRTRQGLAAPAGGHRLGVGGGIGAHGLSPLVPLGVADEHRHRRAQRGAVAHAAQQLEVVALPGHAGTAAGAQAATSELMADVLAGHGHAGGHALEDAHQGRAVGLTGSEIAQGHGRVGGGAGCESAGG